ncbi:P-loop containing nucleoside triphosphate hydrolase protein [Stachybotrys elegans]|uniref:P-loop containing nucleoside triphosphate hydrolase protein n=1 Tax=Stachybotrys elegans TaxID=80388 RepID=A0A8K0WWE0_9HYPO|nr:P-loop containing nucleoside triphosphate hydrolase protein [Stachybotrys elegans]
MAQSPGTYLPPISDLDFTFEGEDSERGTICEIRQYERIKNAKGDIVLLKSGVARPSLLKPLLDEWSANSAIVLIRDMQDIKEPRTKLEIQSSHIKQALKECVPEFANFDLDRQAIVLENEPRCVFHYRQQLMDYHNRCSRSGEVDAASHVALLLNYMFRTLDREVRQFNQFMVNPIIQPALEFVNLWMAFIPGQMIYAERKCNHVKARGRLLKLKSFHRCPCTKPWCRESAWSAVGFIIDYNGDTFGHRTICLNIEPYDGVKPLQDLLVLPLQYHPEHQSIRSELIARGKIFVQLTGQHYKEYTGTANLLGDTRHTMNGDEDDIFPERATHVSGRIVIDCKAFSEARPTHQPYFDSSQKGYRPDLNQEQYMSDEEYMICANEVAGYSLRDKKWGWFSVEMIRDVEFNENAFDGLILQEDQKHVMVSLVRSHADGMVEFDDMIRGKGKGLVFLLHGDPGTGKTLTAESIADLVKAPLMRIDAGMLGSDASELANTLQELLQLAERWKAIALLDEADIFLQQRDRSHIERNRLVAVFLTMVEYFTGILFLTTNRVTSFDRAFKSRVHLAVSYPALKPTNRALIWKSILTQPGVDIERDVLDTDYLESIDDNGMNGRQIKNIIQIASTLAAGEGRPVGKSHLELSVNAMKGFDREFEATVTDETRDDDEDNMEPGSRKRRRLVDN